MSESAQPAAAPNTPSVLARILSKDVKLPVSKPEDGQSIEMGQIYVAPPNWHLILKPEKTKKRLKLKRLQS